MPLRLFPLYFRGSSVSWRLCVVTHSDMAERVSAIISTNQERLLAMQFVPPAPYVRAAVGEGFVNNRVAKECGGYFVAAWCLARAVTRCSSAWTPLKGRI
jgi:hypothetical protein